MSNIIELSAVEDEEEKIYLFLVTVCVLNWVLTVTLTLSVKD